MSEQKVCPATGGLMPGEGCASISLSDQAWDRCEVCEHGAGRKKTAAYHRSYRQKHRARLIEYYRAHYRQNRKRRLVWQADYDRRNRARIAARKSRWYFERKRAASCVSGRRPE